MKFSPKCRTKKLGMIYNILGSFCSFCNWEGLLFCPKPGLGKSLAKAKARQSIQCVLIRLNIVVQLQNSADLFEQRSARLQPE